jgi:hypothetical protein
MKYLKKFESNISNTLEDIKNLCETQIAYIIDNMPDFKFLVHKLSVANNTYIKSIYKQDSEIYQLSFFRSQPNHNKFCWVDVKENIIPLFDILNRRYDLKESSIIVMTNKSEPIKTSNKEEPGIDHILNIEDILKDNIRDDSEIMHIQITIQTK